MEPDMIPTAERVRELFSYDPETGHLLRAVDRGGQKAGSEAGTVWINRTGHKYKRIEVDGKKHQVHRIIWLLVYGKWPSEHIDHIDGDGLNNRLSNLREATNSENMLNMRVKSNSKSGIKGVSWFSHANKWRARISLNGKAKTIGYFETKEAAFAAYCKAAQELHGEFARVA